MFAPKQKVQKPASSSVALHAAVTQFPQFDGPRAGVSLGPPLNGHDFGRIAIHPPAATGCLQTKLTTGEPGGVHEQEADRMANLVDTAAGGASPHIPRFSGPPAWQTFAVPASVGQTLSSPGKPLEPALRNDMEHRFGHDFSRVRIHSDRAAGE